MESICVFFSNLVFLILSVHAILFLFCSFFIPPLLPFFSSDSGFDKDLLVQPKQSHGVTDFSFTSGYFTPVSLLVSQTLIVLGLFYQETS